MSWDVKAQTTVRSGKARFTSSSMRANVWRVSGAVLPKATSMTGGWPVTPGDAASAAVPAAAANSSAASPPQMIRASLMATLRSRAGVPGRPAR